MSRGGAPCYPNPGRVPRASGDEPYGFFVEAWVHECSPRERG